ncbi:MAG: tetratricopeptide repeat protein, partial [Kofleriaceae bacterium]|nr:tetratricopeptide repeat protein [Kofleriaceae bacterium]
YLSVVAKYPNNKIAKEAAFTAAVVYESMAYFERAAEAYETTADKFAKSDKGADALFNAGVLRQALGQNKRAIIHYKAYSKRFRKTRKDAQEVAYRIAVVHELAGEEGLAEKAYNAYLKAYRGGTHQLKATVFSGRAAYKLGQYRRAGKQLSAALKLFKKSSGAEAKRNRKYAAEARYYQGELLYRKYDKVSLKVKARKLDKALATKMKLLDQASTVYLDVVEINDASWATAALYRIGSVMEEFANSLRDAPTPPGFSEADAELYREALDNEVITIEEKAIELYIVGYKKAIELKVYNEYTQKLRAALGRMAASQFPPAKESRGQQRLGDRTPTIGLTKEVIRGE